MHAAAPEDLAFDSQFEVGVSMNGYRRFAALSMVSTLVEPGSQIGGCGFCTGLGHTLTYSMS